MSVRRAHIARGVSCQQQNLVGCACYLGGGGLEGKPCEVGVVPCMIFYLIVAGGDGTHNARIRGHLPPNDKKRGMDTEVLKSLQNPRRVIGTGAIVESQGNARRGTVFVHVLNVDPYRGSCPANRR